MRLMFYSALKVLAISAIALGNSHSTIAALKLQVYAQTAESPPLSLTNMPTEKLCILSAEHSSNIQKVASELKRRRLSRSVCDGVSILHDYNHFSKKQYLEEKKKKEAQYALIGDKKKLGSAHSAELCILVNSGFLQLSQNSDLISELSRRELSPAQCELAIVERQASLCHMISEIDSSMTFLEIEKTKNKNREILKELDLYDANEKTCEKLEQENIIPNYISRKTEETFNIDRLQIRTVIETENPSCSSGTINKVYLSGVIGPDSSFAMQRILKKMLPCKDASGEIIVPTLVSLKSGGGILDHGYQLGLTLRSMKAATIVESDNICASSCAVAFLGGKSRRVEDGGTILLHAPYFSGKNEYDSRDVNCEVGDVPLNELESYYKKMTDDETGARLFDRTLWYCSSEDGWVITGGAAAKLYGISTHL